MFFKKKFSPEQFQFATVISAANLYKRLGSMPTYYEIENAVRSLANDGGYKLSSEQENVLKLASVSLCRGQLPDMIKKIALAQDPDGIVYAKVVLELQSQVIRFI
jgi:hypothetical protein